MPRYTNMRMVREHPRDLCALRRAQQHRAVCALAARVAMIGPGAIEVRGKEDEGALIGWFKARPHADETGVVYIMPIICHGTTVKVGSKKMRVHPGEIFAFDDFITHSTSDTAPCVGIVYACGARGEDGAVEAIDKFFRKLAA